MRRGHEVDVERATRLLLEENLRQALDGNLEAHLPERDLAVLAVDALERASAEKDGSAAGIPADGRLLPQVQRRAREAHTIGLAAYARYACAPVAGAAAGAQCAGM